MSNSDDPFEPVKQPDAPTFDAYTEFLQLPPGPRPPHLYQLLQVELFCPHPEQIEQAVRKQFRKIKSFEEHPDQRVRERIQDVLSHIATARVVLTHPDQKQQYDEMLAVYLKVDRDEIIQSRAASRPPEFQVVVTAGPSRVGSRFELLPDRTIAIGADPRCDLTLAGSRMKPAHVRLAFAEEQWKLQAAERDGVTLVNDARCTQTVLNEGDVVELGGYRLRFERINAPKVDPRTLPPPLSLILREGPSIPETVFNALPPNSILLGSDSTALWQLFGGGSSLHHARIENDAALWEIRDLQSETGTQVNGYRVTRTILQHRDIVTIGRFLIQVSFRR